MLNRQKFLIIHGIDVEKWAKKHELEQFECPCSQCGQVLKASLPFVYGQLRGLVAPQCDCGNKNTPYCVVRDARYGDLFSGTGELR